VWPGQLDHRANACQRFTEQDQTVVRNRLLYCTVSGHPAPGLDYYIVENDVSVRVQSGVLGSSCTILCPYCSDNVQALSLNAAQEHDVETLANSSANTFHTVGFFIALRRVLEILDALLAASQPPCAVVGLCTEVAECLDTMAAACHSSTRFILQFVPTRPDLIATSVCGARRIVPCTATPTGGDFICELDARRKTFSSRPFLLSLS
jgi:hypothetical protein